MQTSYHGTKEKIKLVRINNLQSAGYLFHDPSGTMQSNCLCVRTITKTCWFDKQISSIHLNVSWCLYHALSSHRRCKSQIRKVSVLFLNVLMPFYIMIMSNETPTSGATVQRQGTNSVKPCTKVRTPISAHLYEFPPNGVTNHRRWTVGCPPRVLPDLP